MLLTLAEFPPSPGGIGSLGTDVCRLVLRWDVLPGLGRLDTFAVVDDLGLGLDGNLIDGRQVGEGQGLRVGGCILVLCSRWWVVVAAANSPTRLACR